MEKLLMVLRVKKRFIKKEKKDFTRKNIMGFTCKIKNIYF
jgi:hypothetical protein